METGAELAEISRVILRVDENVSYTAGNDLGRAITISCPWGTQKMAEDLLERFFAYRYQPYTASGAAIDPAAEIGDYVDAGNLYGGIFSRSTIFGRRFLSDLSAPMENEVDHEYPYQSPQDRETRRVKNAVRELGRQVESEFLVQASKIAAKVSSVSDGTDFGWVLTDTCWEIQSGGGVVLRASRDGLEITGRITASSGLIGGFDIQNSYLSSPAGFNTGDSTTVSGVYIGTNGIKLGQNFWIDSGGNLYAKNGTFEGNVWAGSIQSGGGYGTFDGYGITASTIGTTPLTGGVNTSLGYGNFSHDVFNDIEEAVAVRCGYIHIGQMKFGPKNIQYTDQNGKSAAMTVLGRIYT